MWHEVFVFFLSSWASVCANVRRKLVVGEGKTVGGFERRETDLDGLASMPREDGHGFWTLFVCM